MNRRGFISALAGAFGLAAVDLEELLWIPGKKFVSVPAARVKKTVQFGTDIDVNGPISSTEWAHNFDFAMKSLSCRLKSAERHAMAKAQFIALPLPSGVDVAETHTVPGIGPVREIRQRFYSEAMDRLQIMARYDILVQI